MKRRPTPKTIRAGHTLFYPALDWSKRRHVVGSIMVGSDKQPYPEPNVCYEVLPRRYVAELLEDGFYYSYSRREIESWIKRHGRHW